MKPFASNLTNGNEDEMHDLLHDAFCKAVKYIHKVPADDKELKMWISVIIRNIFLDGRRKGLRRPTIGINGYDVASNQNIFSYIHSKEVAEQLNKLYTPHMLSILLYTEGYSYAEISDMLKIKINTIKGGIRYARQSLEKKFNKRLSNV